MPFSPAHQCAERGCPRLVRGGSRCPAHAIVRDKSYAGNRARAAYVASHQCVDCGGRAHELDHVLPLHAGGRDTPDNWAARCLTCHRAKTRAER